MDSSFAERMLPVLFGCVAVWLGLPWVVIWLSESFRSEIPLWSAWLVFVGPAVIVLAILSVQALMTRQPNQRCPITPGPLS
jgi:hypothetical protein